jgi:hypothetical protein
MMKRQWDKARPHAEAAAQTGAGWAMICAQDCAEGGKDWARAEEWARATSERYPAQQWDRWFILCKQTGQGDDAAASAFTKEWVEANASGATSSDLARIAWYYVCTGEPKKALPILCQLYQATPSTVGCAEAWIVADMIDDRATRDEYFKYMEARHLQESPRTGTLWQLFHQALDRDNGQSLDLKAIENNREGAQAASLWLPDFMIGRFLLTHGKQLDARKYLEKSAENPSSMGWFKALARDTTRKLDQPSTAPKAKTEATKS